MACTIVTQADIAARRCGDSTIWRQFIASSLRCGTTGAVVQRADNATGSSEREPVHRVLPGTVRIPDIMSAEAGTWRRRRGCWSCTVNGLAGAGHAARPSALAASAGYSRYSVGDEILSAFVRRGDSPVTPRPARRGARQASSITERRLIRRAAMKTWASRGRHDLPYPSCVPVRNNSSNAAPLTAGFRAYPEARRAGSPIFTEGGNLCMFSNIVPGVIPRGP